MIYFACEFFDFSLDFEWDGGAALETLETFGERLKLYEELELAESNWPADMDDGQELFDRECDMYREELQAYVIRLGYVLDKMTNPSSLLEIAALAVSSYDLPIDELPQELQIMLTEASKLALKEEIEILKDEISLIPMKIQTEASKLKEEIEILKDEIPMELLFIFESLNLVVGIE